MRIVRDDIWLCVDCMFAAVNGDMPEDATDGRIAEINAGLESLGPHLVPDFDPETGDGHIEFARLSCDCCGSGLAGEYHRFAVLGPEHTVLRLDADGDVTECTLAAFARDNADLPELDAVRALAIGETITVGGGAAPLVRITRVEDAEGE